MPHRDSLLGARGHIDVVEADRQLGDDPEAWGRFEEAPVDTIGYRAKKALGLADDRSQTRGVHRFRSRFLPMGAIGEMRFDLGRQRSRDDVTKWHAREGRLEGWESCGSASSLF